MSMLRRALDDILERRQPTLDDSISDAEERLRLVRLYGDFTVAYRTLSKPWLKCFGDGRGYVAYTQKMGYTFALGDPIADPDYRTTLLANFVLAFGDPYFVPASASTAADLVEMGYFATTFGQDIRLPLDQAGYEAGLGKRFRRAVVWLQNRGFRILEDDKQRFGTEIIAGLSERFKQTRTVKREMTFLNRSLNPDDIGPDVRRFFALDPQNRPVGFILFDPLYRNNRIVGYAANITRRDPAAPRYSQLAIMRVAIKKFAAEGHQSLNLGLLPLAPSQSASLKEDPVLRAVIRKLYSSGLFNRYILNLQGLAEYKHGFKGQAEDLYFVARKKFPILPMIGLARACKLI